MSVVQDESLTDMMADQVEQVVPPVKAEDDQADQAEQVIPPVKMKRKKGVRWFVNSPWLLFLVPLLAGSVWLVNNTWIITDNLDKPNALLAGPALVGSVLTGWLIITFFKTIAVWCRQAWQAFLSWRKQEGSAFWVVIAIFLMVSVSESGTYFNSLLGNNDLYGSLGFATAGVIDLVAIECMRARLGAARMRDVVGKRLYLLGVIACAGLSAYANTYTALQHFSNPEHTLLPAFMIAVAPWTGCAFPLLIIFLSFTADYTADQVSTKLDPEMYKQQEAKRIKLLEYQRDGLRDRVRIEGEIDELSATSGVKRVQREFVLVRFFFPQKQPHTLNEINKAVMAEMKKIYEPQFKALQEQNQALQNQLQSFTVEAKQAYAVLDTSLSRQLASIRDQHEVDFGLFGSRIEGLQQVAITQQMLEDRLHNDQHYSSLIARYDQGIEVVKQQLSEHIESTVGVLNEQVSERLDRAFAQVNGPVVLGSSGAYDADYGDLSKLAIQYPIVLQWQAGGVRTVSIEEIIRGTKLSPQRVRKAEKDGVFAGTKRPGYYRVGSVIKWLESVQLSPKKGKITKPMASELTGQNTEDVQGIDAGYDEALVTDFPEKSDGLAEQNTDGVQVISGQLESDLSGKTSELAEQNTEEVQAIVDELESDLLVK